MNRLSRPKNQTRIFVSAKHTELHSWVLVGAPSLNSFYSVGADSSNFLKIPPVSPCSSSSTLFKPHTFGVPIRGYLTCGKMFLLSQFLITTVKKIQNHFIIFMIILIVVTSKSVRVWKLHRKDDEETKSVGLPRGLLLRPTTTFRYI